MDDQTRTLYLSRLILNPWDRLVQKELDEPYRMHCTIMQAFPDQLDKSQERVLFRVDPYPKDPRLPTLLVQSLQRPDWMQWIRRCCSSDYLYADTHEPNPDMGIVNLSGLRVDQALSFRLRANPTKRLGRGAEKNASKRIGLYTEDEQLAWLVRKGEQHGFRVLQAQVSRDGKIKDEKKVKRPDTNADAPSVAEEDKSDLPKDVYKLELLSVQFDGILQVTDPNKLVAAVETGIGSAKGFGFGLLSLAPARG
jgi:CRISPR system Cascade subunit CasE